MKQGQRTADRCKHTEETFSCYFSFFVNFSFLNIVSSPSFPIVKPTTSPVLIKALLALHPCIKARTLPISVHVVATAGLSSEAIVSV